MNGTPFQPTDDFQYVGLSEFDQLVLPHVPGVQLPLYRLERSTVLREFCRRTSALIGRHPSIVVDADMDTYLLDNTPPDLEILTLKSILRDTGESLNYKAYQLTADRKAFVLQDSWLSSLDEDALTPLVSLQICRDAERIEEEFFNRWDEGIAAGIIARLMISPKKAWTNPGAAAVFSNNYQAAIAEAKIAVSRDFGIYAPRTVLGGFL